MLQEALEQREVCAVKSAINQECLSLEAAASVDTVREIVARVGLTAGLLKNHH